MCKVVDKLSSNSLVTMHVTHIPYHGLPNSSSVNIFTDLDIPQLLPLYTLSNGSCGC